MQEIEFESSLLKTIDEDDRLKRGNKDSLLLGAITIHCYKTQ